MDSDLEVEAMAMRRLGSINKANYKGVSQIQEFYENSTVLLTGGTGYLGKHLIEKLFRSCNVKKLYLLVRQKNNRTKEQRLTDILDDMLFEDLYKKKPNFTSSIETIHGDIAEIGLGMREGDREILTAEVDIIIHVAALVHFNAPLQDGTIMNIRGTREMIRLARDCKNLRSFVHMSSAYSHATFSRASREVVEDFYPSPIPPDILMDLAETGQFDALDALEPRLTEDWPNTYTFTKAVTEELVRTTTDGLPVCIVRPSTVLNAYTEPLPGWTDMSTLNGASGLCHGIKMGVLHQIFTDPDIEIDYIPVDYVSNAALAAGWEVAKRHAAGRRDVRIYTVCSTRNRLKWGEACDTLYCNKNGVSPRAIGYSFTLNIHNEYIFIILHWLLHLIPAYLADGVSLLLGKKPRYLQLYTKIHKLSEVMKFFTTHQWTFRDANTLELFQKMSPEDQIIFNFNVLDIDWREMMRLWAIGLRKYVLKDGLKDQEYAQRKQFWFRIAAYVLFGVYAYILWVVLNFSISFFDKL